MSDWTDSIVGERMSVDQEFSTRVRESEFTSQEWSLIMTAVEFEIDHPDDPDRARIVADTSKLPGIMPELEKVQEAQGGPMGGGPVDPDDEGGLIDDVKSALGLGGGGDEVEQDRIDAAADLAQEYAERLQSHLEDSGRWDEVRTVAATAEDDDDTGTSTGHTENGSDTSGTERDDGAE